MKPTTANRMGVLSGITYEFNISKRLRLKDPLQLQIGYVYQTMSIQQWIEKQPLLLWNAIYNQGTKISLTKDAHLLLMETAKQKFPELYQEKEGRKLLHRQKRL